MNAPGFPPPPSAPCRHQGKQVKGDLKVFSRIIPFQHLGREKDTRVFIARTLKPGEAPPFTVAMATQQLQETKATAAATATAAAAVAMAKTSGVAASKVCWV
jgi:hypothetical protein